MRNGFDAARDARDQYRTSWGPTTPTGRSATRTAQLRRRRHGLRHSRRPAHDGDLQGPQRGRPSTRSPGTARDTRSSASWQIGVRAAGRRPVRQLLPTTAIAIRDDRGGGDRPWAAGTGLPRQHDHRPGGASTTASTQTCHPPAIPTVLFQYQGPTRAPTRDAASVKYKNPGSGARVFSSGKVQLSWASTPSGGTRPVHRHPTHEPGIQQFTRNMLNDMSRPAAPPGVTATKSTGNHVQLPTPPAGRSIHGSPPTRLTGTPVAARSCRAIRA